MFNGYEFNSVELNASAISPLDAEGDMSAIALINSTVAVTRNSTGSAYAVSLLLGTAYPIRPSSGNAHSFAEINAIVANAVRRAKGDAVSYSSGLAFVEAIVPASGYAIATALLIGIPANELGSGNALATATLISAGNRVKIDEGDMLSVCTASNSAFDVVRNAAAVGYGYAYATGEPAVGVKKDASGSLSCSATVSGDTLINSWLEGHATVAAYATGQGDIYFSTTGIALPVATVTANATLNAKGDGDASSLAALTDSAVRIANVLGSATGQAKYFARAIARREGGAIARAKATATASAMRFVTPRSKLSAVAIALNVDTLVYRLGSSTMTATASLTGVGFANSRSLAPDERTMFIRSAGVRIVTIRQELREIRVTA